MLQTIERFDHWLFYLINRDGKNVVFDHLMPFISNETNFFIPIAVVWLYMMIRNDAEYRTVAIAVIALIGVSELLCSDVFKPLFGRYRPFESISDFHLFRGPGDAWRWTGTLDERGGNSLAMPSAHATNIFAAAVFLSYYFRRLWPLFLVIAVAVAYSRVYTGNHFPMDVIVGAALGTACAAGFIWLTNRVLAKWYAFSASKRTAPSKDTTEGSSENEH